MAHYVPVDEAKSLLPRREGGSLSGFEINPKGVTFDTKNIHEEVFLLLRPHTFSNFGWIFTAALGSVVPILIYILIYQFEIPVSDIISFKSVIILTVIYYSFILSYMFSNFIDWFYDIYLLTNQRLLNYEFTPVTSISLTEIGLEDIQDLRASKIGLLPTVFDYGNIKVSTASKRGEFLLYAVPRPSKFRDLISDFSSHAKNGSNRSL